MRRPTRLQHPSRPPSAAHTAVRAPALRADASNARTILSLMLAARGLIEVIGAVTPAVAAAVVVACIALLLILTRGAARHRSRRSA